MKLLLSSLLATALAMSAMSQITVDETDFAIGFDTVVISTTSDSIDIVTTGANSTWDFSNVTLDAEVIDTLFDVGSTPLGYQFAFNNGILYPNHKADIAEAGLDGASNFGGGAIGLENPYTYFKVDASGYKLVGMAFSLQGIPSPSRHDTIMEIFQFPMNFGNSHNSSGYNKITIPSVPLLGDVVYRRQRFRTTEVDGWGTVTTPFGTFDVLRVKSTVTGSDSIAFDPGFPIDQEIDLPLTREYYWIAKGEKIPVVKAVTTEFMGTESLTSVEFRDKFRGLGVDEENLELTPYPNPTSDFVKVVSHKDIETADVYDMNGRTVLSGAKVDHGVVDLSSLKSGEYVMKLTFVDGSTSVGKVQKK